MLNLKYDQKYIDSRTIKACYQVIHLIYIYNYYYIYISFSFRKNKLFDGLNYYTLTESDVTVEMTGENEIV